MGKSRKKKIGKSTAPIHKKKEVSIKRASKKTTSKVIKKNTLKTKTNLALNKLSKISRKLEHKNKEIKSRSLNKKPSNRIKTITEKTERTHERLKKSLKYNKNFKKPVLIVSGEHSGDLLGAETVLALQTYGITEFYGTGGDAMQESGVEILEHIRTMNVVGFVEALKAYRRLKKLAIKISGEAKNRNTCFAILIDYPGFNLRLAEMLKEEGIYIVYLVSPQIWAWNYKRIHKIKQVVDLMLPLFPFEEKMYLEEGIKAKSIGHPMVNRISVKLRSEKLLMQSTRVVKYTIALIPGSRMGEVRRLLPDMLLAARLLKKKFGKIRFLLPCADSNLRNLIDENLELYKDLNIEVHENSTYQIMNICDAVIIASGTATLETAWFRTPMVMLYRVAWLNVFLASILMRVRFIGIVNILGRKQTIVELLQSEVTPENIFHEIQKILTDDSYKENMINELAYVRRQLGVGKPARKAAAEIIDFISVR